MATASKHKTFTIKTGTDASPLIGARVHVRTTAGEVLDGLFFVYDAAAGASRERARAVRMLAQQRSHALLTLLPHPTHTLRTPTSPGVVVLKQPQPRGKHHVRMIALAAITQPITVVTEALASASTEVLAMSTRSFERIVEREQIATGHAQRRRKLIDSGIPNVAIDIFEEFSRVYPAEVCGWGGPGGKTIVLDDGAIQVPPPYTGEAVTATSATLKERVLKLVQTVHARNNSGL